MRTKLISGLAFLALAGMAAAQSLPTVANIPFDFVVHEKAMKAGNYMIEHVTNDVAVLLIRNDDSGAAIFLVTQPARDGKNPTGVPKLVFKRYGDTYFLSQVWTSSDIGRQVPKSNKETEMARTSEPVELALVIGR
jgi:hypothetical protein